MFHLHNQPPPHAVDPGASKLKDRLAILYEKIPVIYECLNHCCSNVIQKLIMDYLLPRPLNRIKRIISENNSTLSGCFVQDEKTLWNKYSKHPATRITFKMWSTIKFLDEESRPLLRILAFWELNDCLTDGCLWRSVAHIEEKNLRGLFPTPSVLTQGQWKGVELLIPVTPLMDRLVFFLRCKGTELNKLYPPTPDVHNPHNEMQWGWSDQEDCFYYYKEWIFRFFYDMTILFLYKDLYQQIEDEPLSWDVNDSIDDLYKNDIVHQEYSFPIQWQGKESSSYYLGIFKRSSSSKNDYDEYNKMMNQYVVKITSTTTQKVLYCRGSYLAINPISAIVLQWLSMTDDELIKETNGLIGSYTFRKMLLRFIYYLHDWN